MEKRRRSRASLRRCPRASISFAEAGYSGVALFVITITYVYIITRICELSLRLDAIYITLGSQSPDGVVEISGGVNLDTTSENMIVGIEILHASQKMNIKTILSYELELDNKLIQKTA